MVVWGNAEGERPPAGRGGGGAGPDTRILEAPQTRSAAAEHELLRLGGEGAPAGYGGRSLEA